MKWYHWFWAPFIAIVAIVAYVLGTKKGSAGDIVNLELDVLQARAEASEAVKLLDVERARDAVREQHRVTIERLKQEQHDEADLLRSDPAALAEFLTRAAYDDRT